MSVSTESEARVDQLEQRVDELEAELEEKDERIQELEGVREENQQLRETVEERGERINELENEVQQYREYNEKDKAKVKQRVTGVENKIEEIDTGESAYPDEKPRSNVDENRSQTPLDQIVQLPESVAEKELTANQERARFIAKDISDYATKVPAGFVVTSSDIRTILAAKEDGTPHTETVSRVMNFLDRFGQDDVEVVKRHGTRRVVFTEAAANRLHSADARERDQINGVVMLRGAG